MYAKVFAIKMAVIMAKVLKINPESDFTVSAEQ